MRETLLNTLMSNRIPSDRGGDLFMRGAAIADLRTALMAVAPERRPWLVATLADLYEVWVAARDAGDLAVRQEAWKPLGRVLDDAAAAQLAGMRFLFRDAA